MQKADLLAKAKAYIDVAVRSGGKPKRSSSKASTFLTGLAGVYAIAAAIHTTCNEPSQAAVWCQEVISLAPTAVQEGIPSELLYGRVGYLSALLFLAANAGLKLSEHSEILGRIVQLILEDGKWLGQAEGWPLMWEWHGKKYLGAAHGLCGILTVLLHLREVVRQFDGCDDLVRRAIDQLMSMRYSSGNLPSSIGSQQDALVHWCHGATGFVPLMVRCNISPSAVIPFPEQRQPCTLFSFCLQEIMYFSRIGAVAFVPNMFSRTLSLRCR